ncbi:MAG: hypothetical protein WAT21_07045 [Saprospiraceae bacterium]
MLSKEKIKPFVTYLIINLVMAQIGFNVFSLSCYCKKEISFSILPKKDECHRPVKLQKGCCSIKKCTNSLNKVNHPCGKNKAEYKTAHILAGNKLQLGHDQLAFIGQIIFLPPLNITSYPILFWPIPPDKYFLSGNKRRLLMSSLTC